MNWLEIVIGAVFLAGLIIGIARGAIRIAVSLLATVVTFVLVFIATPYVSDAISKATPIQDVIQTKIESMMTSAFTGTSASGAADDTEREALVRNALNAAGIGEDRLSELGISVADIANGRITTDELAGMGISEKLLDGINQAEEEALEEQETAEIPREQQTEAIQGADIPQIFKELLLTNNNSEIYSRLGVSSFPSYVAAYLAKLAVHVVAFLLTLLVVTIVLRAIIYSLNVVANLPVMGVVNRLAGAALGLLGALIVVWVFFLLITMLYMTAAGQDMYAMIQENEILALIYAYNPVLRLATLIKL